MHTTQDGVTWEAKTVHGVDEHIDAMIADGNELVIVTRSGKRLRTTRRP